MLSQGPKDPTSCNDNGSIGTVSWIRAGSGGSGLAGDELNALDGLFAEFNSGGHPVTSHYLKATGFGFSIPPTAVIEGVLVEIYKYETINLMDIVDNSVKLVVGGSITGNDLASGTEWPTSLAYASYGGPSNLWGLTLKPSDVNSNFNFGVVLSATGGGSIGPDGLVDHIRMTVYYDLPGDLSLIF